MAKKNNHINQNKETLTPEVTPVTTEEAQPELSIPSEEMGIPSTVEDVDSHIEETITTMVQESIGTGEEDNQVVDFPPLDTAPDEDANKKEVSVEFTATKYESPEVDAVANQLLKAYESVTKEIIEETKNPEPEKKQGEVVPVDGTFVLQVLPSPHYLETLEKMGIVFFNAGDEDEQITVIGPLSAPNLRQIRKTLTTRGLRTKVFQWVMRPK